MLQLFLSSTGNPDWGQFCGDGVLSPTVEVELPTVEACQDHAEQYRDKYNLGGGNWFGGHVYKDGELIGRVSYNGRYWETWEK